MTTSLPEGFAASEDRVARERIVRLFQFVAAYHTQRYPATRQLSEHEWTLPFSAIPEHESISLMRHVFDGGDSDDEAADADTAATSGAVLLRVQRLLREEAKPPEAPSVLCDWLGLLIGKIAHQA